MRISTTAVLHGSPCKTYSNLKLAPESMSTHLSLANLKMERRTSERVGASSARTAADSELACLTEAACSLSCNCTDYGESEESHKHEVGPLERSTFREQRKEN